MLTGRRPARSHHHTARAAPAPASTPALRRGASQQGSPAGSEAFWRGRTDKRRCNVDDHQRIRVPSLFRGSPPKRTGMAPAGKAIYLPRGPKRKVVSPAQGERRLPKAAASNDSWRGRGTTIRGETVCLLGVSPSCWTGGRAHTHTQHGREPSPRLRSSVVRVRIVCEGLAGPWALSQVAGSLAGN